MRFKRKAVMLMFCTLTALVLSGCVNGPAKTDSDSSTTVPSMSSVWYQVGVSNENFIAVSDSVNEFAADSGVHSFAGGFGVTGLPHSIADAMAMTNPPAGPTNTAQLLNYLASRNVSDVQNFLDTKVLTRIAWILSKLEALEAENAVITFDTVKLRNLLTGESNTNVNYIKIDAVEFYAADLMLSGVAGLICLFDSQNLDVNMLSLINMISNFANTPSSNLTVSAINSFFYNPFSAASFGTVRNSGAFASAKTYLLRAATKADNFIDAYDLNRTTTNSTDLIEYGMAGNVRKALTNLTAWLGTSLNGTSVALDLEIISTNNPGATNEKIETNDIDSLGIKINLGRYLDNHPSLRSHFISLDSSGDPVFYETNATHASTTPVDGGVYCLRLIETGLTFNGLFDSNLYDQLTNTSLTNGGFTNAMPFFNAMLAGGGYLNLAVQVSNNFIVYIPYTNVGYTSQWLNLYTSVAMLMPH